MKRVLVAGATDYLGRSVARAFKARGYWVRALGRSAEKLGPIEEFVDEMSIGEVVEPESLARVCDDIDIVFSSVGITRQKEGLTYQDVDYRGNRNLLAVAEAAGVSKFVYVHVLNAETMQHTALVRAKQAFVEDLERAALDHTVVCPTGFFSDMEDFLAMARAGRVYLFGDGSNRINPIDGADLAEVCVDAAENEERRVDVGGPEVFTYREIAELAFDVVETPRKITSIPRSLITMSVRALPWLVPVRTYGPVQFLAAVMTMDVVGERHGERRLAEHFRTCTGVSTGETSGQTRSSSERT